MFLRKLLAPTLILFGVYASEPLETPPENLASESLPLQEPLSETCEAVPEALILEEIPARSISQNAPEFVQINEAPTSEAVDPPAIVPVSLSPEISEIQENPKVTQGEKSEIAWGIRSRSSKKPLVSTAPPTIAEVTNDESTTPTPSKTKNNVDSSLPGYNFPYKRDPNKWGALFFGEYLHWKAQEDGLEYATNVNGVALPKGTITPLGLKFKWDPGFRAGGGIYFPRDRWDMTFNYTQYTTLASGNTTAVFGDKIFPLWVSDFISSGLSAQHAKASWHLHYKTLDLEFARRFFVGKKLTLRPHAGLREARIDQKYSVSYFFDPTLLPLPEVMSAHNNYHGGGIRGGFDLNFLLVAGFSIVGKASASLLYGKFHLNERFDVPTNNPTIWISQERFHRVRSNLEAMIGINWNVDYKTKHLSIQGGYEILEWFAQNILKDFESPSNPSFNLRNEDLGIQGFNIQARIDF